MKNPITNGITVMRTSFIVSLIALSVLLSACGKKGPLYLPDEPTAKKQQQANIENHNALRLTPLQEES
jgi:predicted small lipoprotein YifL